MQQWFPSATMYISNHSNVLFDLGTACYGIWKMVIIQSPETEGWDC